MKVKFNATTLAVIAVMIAVVTVATGFLPRVPVPGTGGYVHLGDIFVFFSAFAFGPVIGAIVGGVGCGLADILGGWAVWVPLTLIAHGVQGFAAGYFGKGKQMGGLIVAWLIGAICLVNHYDTEWEYLSRKGDARGFKDFDAALEALVELYKETT